MKHVASQQDGTPPWPRAWDPPSGPRSRRSIVYVASSSVNATARELGRQGGLLTVRPSVLGHPAGRGAEPGGTSAPPAAVARAGARDPVQPERVQARAR